ncbi:MAG: hypothetical protein ABIW16_04190 [Sphingomicrobium sp.]
MIRFALAALAAFGSAATAQTPPQPLFASDAPLHLTIRGAVSEVASSHRRDVTRAATLGVVGGESEPVMLSPRGITRLRRDVCQFAPLRVDFTSRLAAPSLFAGQKRLKLVTHCRAFEGYQQKLLLEYAAYRMYNLLTPLSLRARLAMIDYTGSDGRLLTSRYGFFLEDLGDTGRRNGLAEGRAGERIAQASLSPADAARFAVFEYMISNFDWSMVAGPRGDVCCHNGRLLQRGVTYVPVPYDFDYSGLIDAPYALPPVGIPVASVRQRRYRGYCRHNAEALQVVADLRAKRGALLAVFGQVPGINPRTSAKAIAFLDGFFNNIADDRSAAATMLKTCL